MDLTRIVKHVPLLKREKYQTKHVCNPDDPSDYAFYEKITDGYPPAKYYSPMELDFGSCGHSKEIDWEQRRYELIKLYSVEIIRLQMEAGIIDCGYSEKKVTEYAISMANELIAQLKKEWHENK